MAEQRIPIEVKVPTPQEEIEKEVKLNLEIERRKKLKAGLRVSLLERSAISTALNLDFLPKDLHGEWVRNEKLRINDKKDLNFEVYKSETNRGLHDANADGSIVVGDLVLMTCSKENKEIIDELRQEEYNQRHGKPGDNKPQAEERGFISEQRTLVGSHIGTANDSRAVPIAMPVTLK